MKFEPVDLQTLPRGQMFYYFSRMAPTGYSLTCHHAATDGYHVHLFLQDLQKDMDTFEQYLL